MNEKNISSNKEEDLGTNSDASVANNDVSCTSSASNASATGDDVY